MIVLKLYKSFSQAANLNCGAISRCIWQQSVLCDQLTFLVRHRVRVSIKNA